MIKKIQELLKLVNGRYKNSDGSYNNDFECCDKNKDYEYDVDKIYGLRVQTGGVSGGSCWEDSDPQEFSYGNSADVSLILDKIVSEICLIIDPNMSLKNYISIKDDIFIIDNYSIGEYYGNRTDYIVLLLNEEKFDETILKYKCLINIE